MLIIPFQLSGIGIQRDGGVGEERIVGDAGKRHGVTKLGRVVGCPGSVIDQIKLGVVRALVPDRAASALVERDVVPGVAARLTRPGERVETPQLLARLDVERDDEAAARTRAGGDALDHLVADDQRRAAQVEHRTVGGGLAEFDLVVPGLLARVRIECDHVQVRGRREDAPATKAEPHLHRRAVGGLVGVAPQLLSGRCVERQHDVGRRVEEHHPVVDERAGHAEAEFQRRAPGRRQVLHVGAVDMFERAEILAIIGAAPLQPVARGRLLQHRGGNGSQARKAFGR